MAPPKPSAKRPRKTKPLVENDLLAAEGVTHENLTYTTKTGVSKTKRVLVPLVAKSKNSDTPLAAVQTPERRAMASGERSVSPPNYEHYETPGCESYDRQKKNKVRCVIDSYFIY
jgi:hypothetical protein